MLCNSASQTELGRPDSALILTNSLTCRLQSADSIHYYYTGYSAVLAPLTQGWDLFIWKIAEELDEKEIKLACETENMIKSAPFKPARMITRFN